MNNGNPTGEVRPMIDREPPNAAETRGASVRTRFCGTSGLVRALGALPIALERRIVGFQKPATGESRLIRSGAAEWMRSGIARIDAQGGRCGPGPPLGATDPPQGVLPHCVHGMLLFFCWRSKKTGALAPLSDSRPPP